MSKHGQVLLEHWRIVAEEKVVEEFGNEFLQTCERNGFIVKVECQEWRTQRIKALPVHKLGVGGYPGLE